MIKVGRYAKAIVSALAAGSAALATAIGDDVIVTGEWVTIGLAVLGALGITYVIPNTPPNTPPDVPPDVPRGPRIAH